MDPSPSLPASIDTLLAGITSTSLTITNFIRAVRSARPDLAAVTRELADLCLVLELLRDDHVVPTRMQPRVRDVLTCCSVILQRVTSLAAAATDSGRGDRGDAARVRWSDKEKAEMVQLWIALQTYREALGLIDEVAHLNFPKDERILVGVLSPAQGLKQASRRILAEISHLRDMVPQAETVTGDSKMALDLYLNDLVTYTAVVCREMRRRQKSVGAQQNPTSISPTSPGKSNRGSDKSPTSRAPGRPIPSEPERPAPKEPDRPALEDRPAQEITPDATPDAAATTAAAGQEGSIAELDSQQSIETCGPRFPKPRTYSYHMPRKLPPSPCNSDQQQQISELPDQTTDARREAQQSYFQAPPKQHKASGESDEPCDGTGAGQLQPPLDLADDAASAGQHRTASPDQLGSPALLTPDGWGTSMYVPASPSSDHFSQRTSGLSSDRTSFQTTDSTVNRSTYRSSVSTAGTHSVIDSVSSTSSPRLPYRPLLKSKSATSRADSSHSTVSSITSSIMGRIPGFRIKRQVAYLSTPQAPGATGEVFCSTPPSTASSSTVDRTPLVRRPSALLAPPEPSSPCTPRTASSDAPVQRSGHHIELFQSEGLSDGKSGEIFHMDVSPSGSILASQHAGHVIKIWSVTTGGVESTISPRVKFQAGMRSRMYFIHSHAIISETSTLIAVAASFGNTIEVWNWASRKKLQTIDHAARWACVRGEANSRPLAVYRSETNRIDLFATAARDDSASVMSSSSFSSGGKKPFLPSRSIDVALAGLPFLPHFPDLVYSATAPLLIGAAGPRPRAPEDQQQCILMAWQTDDPDASGDSDGNPHRPYRWVVPPQAELLGALPACLACYGSSAVSVWFPANYRPHLTVKGEWKRVPVAVTKRHVLVWDLSANATRLFSVPAGPCCVSPDCRLVAYCDAEAGGIVVLDVESKEVAWKGGPGESSLSSSGRPVDLKKVNVFHFTDDGGILFVGDKDGGVGIYDVKMRPAAGIGGRRLDLSDTDEAIGDGESIVCGL